MDLQFLLTGTILLVAVIYLVRTARGMLRGKACGGCAGAACGKAEKQ